MNEQEQILALSQAVESLAEALVMLKEVVADIAQRLSKVEKALGQPEDSAFELDWAPRQQQRGKATQQEWEAAGHWLKERLGMQTRIDNDEMKGKGEP